MGPLSWLSHAPLLARMPLTPFFGASFGGVAVIATTAAAGIAGPQARAQAASLRAARPRLRSSRRGTAAPARAAGTAARRRPSAEPHKRRVAPAANRRHRSNAARERRTTRRRSRAASRPPAEPRRPPPAAPPRQPSSPARAAPTTPAPPGTPPDTAAARRRLRAVPPAPALPPRMRRPASAPARTRPCSRTPALSRSPAGRPRSRRDPRASRRKPSASPSADNPALFTAQPAVAPDGTLSYTPAADANGVATVTVTAVDDGGTANGGTDTSAPRTFTITVAPVNDAPELHRRSEPDRARRRRRSVGRRLGDRDLARPGERVVAEPSRSPPAPTPRRSSPSSRRSPRTERSPTPRRRTPTASPRSPSPPSTTAAPRTAAPTPALLRPSRSPSRRSTTPRASPPARTRPRCEDAGAQSVGGWATAISAGPANESSQTVSFTASADNPALFSVQPAIAPDGTLTYTPAPDANGVATVTVTAVDNGGTANGGIEHQRRRPSRSPSTPSTTLPASTRDQISRCLAPRRADRPGLGDGHHGRAGGRVLPERHLHRLEHQPGALRRPTRDRSRRNAHLHAGPARARKRDGHRARGDNGGTSGGGSDTSAPQTFTITIL